MTTLDTVRLWCSGRPCYSPNKCCRGTQCVHEDYCELFEREAERLETRASMTD